MGLTVRKIEGFNKAGMYRDERTLFLKVSQSSEKDPSLVSKSWVQRIMTNGKRQDFGLGPWPVVSVGEARARAMANRIKAERGQSIQKRIKTESIEQAQTDSKPKATKKGIIFRDHALAVIQFRKQSWKNQDATVQAWENSLEQYAFPSIGDKLLKDITPQDVLNILKPYWFEKNAMMQQVKQRIGVTMQDAVTQGLASFNPAIGIEKSLPKPQAVEGEKGFKAVPHAEVKNVIAKIKASNATASSKLCFEFCILTASRPSEAREAQWSEINEDAKTWTVPAQRMKAGKTHTVPLSSRALEILKEAKGLNGEKFVFPGTIKGEALGKTTINKLCREKKVGGQPHAIARVTFRSWAAEQGISREVAEAAEARGPKGPEASYQRSKLFELRVPVAQAWSDYLAA